MIFDSVNVDSVNDVVEKTKHKGSFGCNANIATPPKWLKIRVDIAGQSLLIRHSSHQAWQETGGQCTDLPVSKQFALIISSNPSTEFHRW